MSRTAVTLLAIGLVTVGLAGCGSSGSSGSGGSLATSSAPSSDPAPTGPITVFAAASLTEPFTSLGKQFEAAHPGVKVTFSFAASSALATQITNGAPADVFASASPKNMDQVVTAGAAVNPTTFAKNVMEIAVPPSNPANVTGLSDLARSSVKTALCQPQVPCGATAAQVFMKARLTVTAVTLEPDVKSVLTKVELGEVDAGVVYVTDVQAAGAKVKGLRISPEANASTSYPIVALAKSGNWGTAKGFVDYVLSSAGQRVLASAGFEKP